MAPATLAMLEVPMGFRRRRGVAVAQSMPVKRDTVDSCFREVGFTQVIRAAPEPSSPQALIRAQLALSTA